MNTLQEISNKLQTFASNSLVVNEYNAGDYSTLTSSDHKYPLLYATPVTMTVVDGQLTFGINIAVMDLVYEQSNLIKVLSDLSIIVEEIIIYLNDDSENCNYYAVTQSNFEPFFRQVDMVCGWQGTLNFNIAFIEDKNSIRWK